MKIKLIFSLKSNNLIIIKGIFIKQKQNSISNFFNNKLYNKNFVQFIYIYIYI